MEQRTCNIIMCCKGHCEIDGEKTNGLPAIASYMSKECGCPREDYKGGLMESILKEALFDYIATADKPAVDLRNLFYTFALTEPTMAERICGMFSLVTVYDPANRTYRNGFDEKQIEQSRIYLEEKPDEEEDQKKRTDRNA